MQFSKVTPSCIFECSCIHVHRCSIVFFEKNILTSFHWVITSIIYLWSLITKKCLMRYYLSNNSRRINRTRERISSLIKVVIWIMSIFMRVSSWKRRNLIYMPIQEKISQDIFKGSKCILNNSSVFYQYIINPDIMLQQHDKCYVLHM